MSEDNVNPEEPVEGNDANEPDAVAPGEPTEGDDTVTVTVVRTGQFPEDVVVVRGSTLRDLSQRLGLDGRSPAADGNGETLAPAHTFAEDTMVSYTFKLAGASA
jgi:hypothetical protein